MQCLRKKHFYTVYTVYLDIFFLKFEAKYSDVITFNYNKLHQKRKELFKEKSKKDGN